MAWGIDLFYAATTKLQPAIILRNYGSSLPDVARASHYLQALGLVTTLPAVVTGVQQMYKAIGNGGLYQADGQTLRPKIKVTMVHAALNDVAFLASLYSWWTRRGNVGLVPSDLNVLISGVLFPVLMYSASLGGRLTYNYGMGMNLAGGKKEKTK